MNLTDIILLIIICAAVISAVRLCIKKRKSGGCCGNCSNCSSCSK